MIQVCDNGIGIPKDHLLQIAQQHVTSKCHSIKDLYTTKTFGYRGEALAALANMSILKITSKFQYAENAYTAIWKDGRLVEHSIDQEKQKSGTTVTVPSLFCKYPVRRKYSNTNLDSLKHIVILFALTFPQISFNLIDAVRNINILSLKKCSSSLGVFQQLFGYRFIQDIRTHIIHENEFRIQGFFGNRVPSKVHQYIYINNHYISPNSNLYKLVSLTFNNYLGKADHQNRKGKDHPIFLINIEWGNCSSYEICFLEENKAYPLLEDLLRKLVMRHLYVTDDIQLDKQSTKSAKKQCRQKKTNSYIQHLQSSSNSTTSGSLPSFDQKNPLINDYSQNLIDRSHLLHHSNISGEFVLPSMTSLPSTTLSSSSSSSSSKSSNIGLHIPNKLQRQDLIPAKILGQVDCKWIACTVNQFLVLIDQHAADERIKLETMLDSTLDVRFLEPNIYIHITKQEIDLAMKYQSVLRNWGIYIEKLESNNHQHHHQLNENHALRNHQTSPHFSKATSLHFKTNNNSNNSNSNNNNNDKCLLRVTRLPHLIVDRCTMYPDIIHNIICDYLHGLASNSISTSSCPPGIIEILKSLACRNAIMFNDPLTLSQCTQLINSLAKTRFPFQCAHGRPSIVPLITLNRLQQQNKKRITHWKNLDKL
ncbi:unnamed protein product [Cunninghamella blakesleeana]